MMNTGHRTVNTFYTGHRFGCLDIITGTAVTAVFVLLVTCLPPQSPTPKPYVLSAQGKGKALSERDVVFGVISSNKTFATKFQRHVLPWWRSGLKGAVYVDQLPDENYSVPRGMLVRPASALVQIAQAAGAESRSIFGWRVVMAVLDLHKLFPDASWYALGDDDTFWVTRNMPSVLTHYHSGDVWYMGSLTEMQKRVGEFGHFGYGGGGIILSSGLLNMIKGRLPHCAAATASMVGDASLANCLLAHGVPVTTLPGLHQYDTGYMNPQLENHPVAAILSIHRRYPELPAPVKQALAVNPSGFAQQAFCNLPIGIISVASGVSVKVWKDKLAKGVDLRRVHLPVEAGSDYRYIHVKQRDLPDQVFVILNTTLDSDTVITTYRRAGNDKVTQGIQTVVVKEPYWLTRWLGAPQRLCCTQTSTSSTAANTQGMTYTIQLARQSPECIQPQFW